MIILIKIKFLTILMILKSPLCQLFFFIFTINFRNDVNINENTPNSWNCSNSEYIHGPSSYVVIGDLNIIGDRELEWFLIKGHKYRPPLIIWCDECCNIVHDSLPNYWSKWIKREQADKELYLIEDWGKHRKSRIAFCTISLFIYIYIIPFKSNMWLVQSLCYMHVIPECFYLWCDPSISPVNCRSQKSVSWVIERVYYAYWSNWDREYIIEKKY